MKRYFFDFDEVPDLCGLTIPSANNACVEALRSMPEYVAEKLEHEGGRSVMVCTIRGQDKAVVFKIILSMHVEDGSGTLIEPPFQLADKSAAECIAARSRCDLADMEVSGFETAEVAKASFIQDRQPLMMQDNQLVGTKALE